MRTLATEFRHALRKLLERPVFSFLAVVTLALGIGATTAIFTLLDTVLLEPLPLAGADRLVRVYGTSTASGNDRSSTSLPDYHDYKERSQTLEGLAGFIRFDFNVAGEDRPQRLAGAYVTHDFFTVLKVDPILGRNILPAEDRPGGDKVVVLSYGLWQSLFGGDSAALGRTLRIDDQEHRVIGVMPPGFEYPETARMWTPFGFGPNTFPRQVRFLRLIGRLAPGTSLAAAREEITTVADQLAAEYPDTNAGQGVAVVGLREQLTGAIRPALLVLMGASLFVLLVACANVVSLLLARSAERRGEIVLRQVLGAGRGRLLGHFMAESALLAFAGGVLGVGLAYLGVEALVGLIEAQGAGSFLGDRAYAIPRLQEVGIDFRTLGFTVLVIVATILGVSTWPVWQARHFELGQSLKEGGGGTPSRRGTKTQRFLVVTQIVLALSLTIGAGLLIRSFSSLQEVEPGFVNQDVLTFEIALPWTKYAALEQTTNFYSRLLERIRALPGVISTGAVWGLPMSGTSGTTALEIEGRPESEAGAQPEVRVQAVAGDYFETLGIRLVEGRLLTEHDDADTAPVVLVNETMARRFWPDESPLGRRLVFRTEFGPAGQMERAAREIVGVVADVKNAGLAVPVEPELYVPYRQNVWRMMSVTIRATRNPRDLVPALRQEVWAIDPDLPIANLRTLEEIVGASVVEPKINTSLLTVFAAIALALAAVGIFGVMSQAMQHRRREIGLRMALGAEPGHLVRQLVGEGLGLVGVGIVGGLALAWGLTRVLRSLLFGVTATDLNTFVGVPLLALAVAAMACWLPARRAVRLDPIETLRHE